MVATPSVVPDVLSETGASSGGLHLLTEGHWLWYSDLTHYVWRYHVELDPAFIEHARSDNWTVPQVGDQHLEAMVTLLLGGRTRAGLMVPTTPRHQAEVRANGCRPARVVGPPTRVRRRTMMPV